MDNFSRKSWVILLKKKYDMEAKLKELKAFVEIESGEKLCKFRIDNEGEFWSNKLSA